MFEDLDLISIDELLALRTAVNCELKKRAVEELAIIDQRKAQLLELMGDAPAVPVADKLAVRRTRVAGVAKYRNPANPEQTWTGRGKRPSWLAGAEDLTAFQLAA